jgi:Caspase domain/EF hand/WD domain, G-beta repeat
MLSGHLGVVTTVGFSPDGTRIVSGGIDGSTRIWNSETGELLVSLFENDKGDWLAITREGFFATSDKGVSFVGVVRGLDVYSIDQFYQQLYRPDVIRQKLSFDPVINERVKLAAANVNLSTILASRAPPEITIVSPKAESDTNDDHVTVEANLTDRGLEKGGGIGRIEWRVNGVTRAVDDLQVSRGGGTTKVKQKLVLPREQSLIEVVAYNQANLVASLPAQVSVSVKSSAPPPKPHLHVLAIGIDKYQEPRISGLKYSIVDAQSVLGAFELAKSDKTLFDDVILHPLFDEKATAQNIQAEFKRLGGIVQPHDVCVLYLAGHGVTVNGRFYFVPHNAKGPLDNLQLETVVGQNQLQDWLTQVPAFQSVLIYDSCESGSAAEDRSGFRGLQQLVAAEKLSRSMGRTVLSATSDVTAALEGYEKHGVFTYVLLDAFAHADRDNDGKITTEELADYLRAKLPALTDDLAKKYPNLNLSRQEPQVKLSGAPFVLTPRANIADINRVR